MLAELGRFTTLAGLTARTTLSSRKGAVTWVVALLPLYVVGGLAASGREVNILLFQTLVVPLLLQVVLIIIALVHASRLLREEIEDNTLPYLTTRRISKASLVAYKFIGYYGSALLVVIPPLVVSYVIALATTGTAFGADLAVLGALVAMSAVGALAYGGLFLLLGFSPLKRPLVLGLLYGFIWEPVMIGLPGNVPLLSVSHYLWSIGSHIVTIGILGQYPTSLDAFQAAMVPIAIGLAAIALVYFLFLTREVKSKD